MKLPLVWLLLASLCLLSSWSVSSVIQTSHISATEGDMLAINCCWTPTARRFSFNWMKNGTIVKKYLIKVEETSQPQKCVNLTFTNINQNDSGTYICRVLTEQPDYTVLEGNGTVITVRAKGSTEENVEGSKSLPLVVSLLLLLLLLLLHLMVLLCLRRRKAALAARVIYEVPHYNSEVADVDKHSTGSSAHSSQWCQVTVYESFDYFESLQSREAK